MARVFNRAKDDTHVRIGFTHGDINGIGYEIIIKSLIDNQIVDLITPIVFGISKVAFYHRKTLNLQDFNFNLIRRVDMANPRMANIVNIYDKEVKIDLGTLSNIAGEMAHLALKTALDSLDHGKIDAIVTAPINKKNIQSQEFTFSGHTEFFADRYDVHNYLMLMVSNELRIGIITGHIPIKDVSAVLNEDLVMRKIMIMHDTFRRDFAIQKPKIAILGLNPHAGDNGLLGTEEQEILVPVINKLQENNMLVYGPYPADGFFGTPNYKEFDGILAIYHDQGMIPFKTLAFESGVNYTAGLPVIRTSPAHGTAFDIAGQDRADPASMRAAIYLACDIYRNRTDFDETNANPLQAPRENGFRYNNGNHVV